jgi:uncharacterized membrane protein
MGVSGKFRQWPFDKKRLEAFSDGVFAIVMTLLVLELRLPHIADPMDPHKVWEAIIEVMPVFFSWVVSFFFVALIWLHHHSILKMCSAADYGTMWINTFLLFFICLLPFPTKMMGEYPMSPIIVMIWGMMFSATTFMLTWFYYYNVKHYLGPTYDKTLTMKNVRFSVLGGPTIYIVAALLAFVSVYISYVIYSLVPLLYILPLDKEMEAIK